MTKYLRAKTNGIIFEYNERLAANPDVEVVTKEEAYPELFAPVNLAKRSSAVNISIPEAVTKPPVEVAPELLAEASKPFGGPRAKAVMAKAATAGLSFGDI